MNLDEMKVKELRNLTPHAIVLRSEVGDVTVPPSGIVARVTSVPSAAVRIEGCPVPIAQPPTWGEIEELPRRRDGVLLIVSSLVAGRCNRSDVVSPGTGPADNPIRDREGHARVHDGHISIGIERYAVKIDSLKRHEHLYVTGPSGDADNRNS